MAEKYLKAPEPRRSELSRIAPEISQHGAVFFDR